MIRPNKFRDTARRVLTLAALMGAAGAALAAGAAFALRGLLYGITPLDPIAWLLAAAALAVAAGIANVVPARRAMRVAPTTALRTD